MTISNISEESTWLIVTKCNEEPSGAEGTELCSDGPGHMTKMADMPVASINL